MWDELYERLVRADQRTSHHARVRQHAAAAERVASSSASVWATSTSPLITARFRARSAYSREHRLKAGQLKALVATASLELGIDVGEVDLVCQLGSPRSIATFLQLRNAAGVTI